MDLYQFYPQKKYVEKLFDTDISDSANDEASVRVMKVIMMMSLTLKMRIPSNK